MAYNKQNFKSGDLLRASQLNAMDEQIAANEIALEGKQPKGDYLSSIEADSKYQEKGSYATSADIASKQDTISDLNTIREGASLGKTALQSVPEEYATQTDVENTINDINNTIGFAAKEDETIAWGIRDNNGHYVIKIDNDGVVNIGNLKVLKLNDNNVTQQPEETTSVKSWLTGKKCFVLGDSLSADSKATGSWHQKFCEITGAELDADLNRGNFSIGGTATIGTHTEKDACCQMRAKRLVEYYNEGNDVDIIFIQNVNDINNNRYSAGINGKGVNTDMPFFENQVITYNKDILTVTTPSTEVLPYFKENINTILEGVTPMLGTVVDMLYSTGTSGAKELKLETEPTQDGNITITFKHGANYRDEVYNVAVKAGMTKKEVVNAILEWQYQDVGYYDDVEGENGDSVIFSSPYSLTFDGGNTGIEATISDTGTVNRYPIAYKGSSTSAEDFNNTENWAYESSISYWSAQKGLIEYLQKNIPTAKIFILILPYYKLKYPVTEGSNYLRTDGSFNMEYWSNELANSTATKLYNEQKLVAKYYSCTAIDVIENCSINPINIESFYPSNDVHPKTSGYNVWGETIARLIN